MPDEPRPVATERDTLTIEETADLYARSGHPRTVRTIQRYCATGHLECVKAQTSLGDKYFVHRESIGRHLAQIEELAALDTRTDRDTSRPVAVPDAAPVFRDEPRPAASEPTPSSPVAPEFPKTTEGDMTRPAATEPDVMSRPDATPPDVITKYAERLEGENDRLRDDIAFLRDQVHTKDRQIDALLERDRETNFLVQGLQHMLSPLLGSPMPRDQRDAPSTDHR